MIFSRLFAAVRTAVVASAICWVGLLALSPINAPSSAGSVNAPVEVETAAAATGGTPHFNYVILNGAKAGNKDAQRALAQAARAGVERAQRACDRLGINWKN